MKLDIKYTFIIVMLACIGIVVANNYMQAVYVEHAVVVAKIKKLKNTPLRILSTEEIKDQETGKIRYRSCNNTGRCAVGYSKEGVKQAITTSSGSKSYGGIPTVDVAALVEYLKVNEEY